MSENKRSHEESLKENEVTKKDNEIEQDEVKEKDGEDDDEEEHEEGANDGAGEKKKAEKVEYVSIDLSNIHEIECPICFGIIRKTKTIRECLHRFCGECIEKCMRSGKNECPICRTHCPTQLSLRDDPNYDALIALLCPDIDKFEKEELDLLKEEFPHLSLVEKSEEVVDRDEEEDFSEEDFVAQIIARILPAFDYMMTDENYFAEEPLVDDDNDVAEELVVEEEDMDDDSSNSMI